MFDRRARQNAAGRKAGKHENMSARQAAAFPVLKQVGDIVWHLRLYLGGPGFLSRIDSRNPSYISGET